MTDQIDIIAMWAGYGLAGIIVAACAIFVVLLAYFRFVDRRFSAILFRRGERRLSLASWHSGRLISKHDPQPDWQADDWPIGERPFYLSYRIGAEKRLFLMFGTMSGPRFGRVKGTHPDMDGDAS